MYGIIATWRMALEGRIDRRKMDIETEKVDGGVRK